MRRASMSMKGGACAPARGLETAHASCASDARAADGSARRPVARAPSHSRGLATTRPTSEAKSRTRRAEPPGPRQPLAPRVDTSTGNQTNLAGGDHQLAHDAPTSRSHPTMGTCVLARHAHPRPAWRGCPGRRAAHRPREPARACAPTTPRTMKGASIVKVECESGLSPPPHPIPSCPWPTPQPTKDTPPRSTKPRGGSQVDQRVIDTYAVQALAAVPLRARMR